MNFKRLFYVGLICVSIMTVGWNRTWIQIDNSNPESQSPKRQAGEWDSKTNAITRYYVAETGNNSDGSSWENAYQYLQTALFVATLNGGGEIWVAEGVYAPVVSFNPDDARTSSFHISVDISLYGGFDTGDTGLSERDWEKNVTVLSGDIGGDDFTDENGVVVDTDNINGKNSYHVVTASGVSSSTVLDGFTITGGQADKELEEQHGGGLYCNGSGASNYCNPTLRNINFTGNFAAQGGGAMYNDGSNGGTSSPTLINVNFTNNRADQGTAMYNYGYKNGTSSPDLTNVSFVGNVAEFNGGAMTNDGYTQGISSPTLLNVSFISNAALKGNGGAMFNYGYDGECSPVLTNVLFANNSAGEPGGAIRNICSLNGNCTPIITNATFSGNQAKSGGAVSSVNGSTPQLRNSILWDNLDIIIGVTLSETVHNESGSKTYLVNSLVQGSGGSNKWTSDESYVDGGGNIDKNPKFILPVNSSGNLRLQSTSPAIDAGKNEYVKGVEKDLDGLPRKVDGDLNGSLIVDMGAYEFLWQYFLPFTKR